MPEIKLLNSFRSNPVDDTDKASVAWSTNKREFLVLVDISSETKSDIQS